VIGDYLPYMNKMDSYTLEDLMEQYGQDVWNFAYLLTTNRSMADDITQDVFLQAYQHVATFRGEASIKTWLLRITRNISYNYRKSAFIRKVLLVDVIVPRGNSHSAEQSFLDNEAANEVWRQVFKLPTKFREVLILNVRYELSVQEIAGLLRIPEGTVKSRLHTARKRLLILLKEEIVHATI
jgi:RNA polymerase sigma-70 factor (ECF subfamily)